MPRPVDGPDPTPSEDGEELVRADVARGHGDRAYANRRRQGSTAALRLTFGLAAARRPVL